MKLYLWGYLDGLTPNYHNGGGLVIITDGDPAKALTGHIKRQGSTLDPGDLPEPDLAIDVPGDTEPRVFIFPDAGCC